MGLTLFSKINEPDTCKSCYGLDIWRTNTKPCCVCGGVFSYDKTDGYIKPELYHPETGEWEILEEDEEHVVRNYHSVALLMPDGRV